MKRKINAVIGCLLASIGLVIAQTPKKVTGVVISEEDDQPVVGASVLSERYNDGNSYRY